VSSYDGCSSYELNEDGRCNLDKRRGDIKKKGVSKHRGAHEMDGKGQRREVIHPYCICLTFVFFIHYILYALLWNVSSTNTVARGDT